MITAKLYIVQNGKWVELPVYNYLEITERLDAELDTGQVQTISDSGAPFEDYSLYRLDFIQDGVIISSESYFGFDDVEVRGENYFIHTIELVEPTRIVMGQPIDGCRITQPIDGSEKKSLLDVTVELLSYKTQLQSTDSSESRFCIHPEKDYSVLENTVSPEFHWECGTLLWECLCDIGNVVNCIPRARVDGMNAERLFIEFIPVNDITEEYEF